MLSRVVGTLRSLALAVGTQCRGSVERPEQAHTIPILTPKDLAWSFLIFRKGGLDRQAGRHVMFGFEDNSS
jgi:hypothetical protein